MNRRQIITSHNPILTAPDSASPLTVGSGSFAFTADVTGVQTLYDEYNITPLCTMAEWAWHTNPAPTPSGSYTYADLKQNVYDFCGRSVTYPRSKFKGNEQVYDHLRQNPHKFNLLNLGFQYKNKKIVSCDLKKTVQTLDLYTGIIESSFVIDNTPVCVKTLSSCDSDTLALQISSPVSLKDLTLTLNFPYPAADITGSDWGSPQKHTTTLTPKSDSAYIIGRKADETTYYINLCAPDCSTAQTALHTITITPNAPKIAITFTFTKNLSQVFPTYEEAEKSSKSFRQSFWEEGGFISAEDSPRAKELERRIILSQYLLSINSSGALPPQETGLTCNSWYGKAHLEMHFIHSAWAPLWNRPALLQKSLPWYKTALPAARENAARNGYAGARWTKMVDPIGCDCPSKISPFIIWQQPHIIEMLDLVLKTIKSEEQAAAYVKDNYILIKETADFITDYLVYDENTDTYNIEPPVIPVQERFEPENVKNPAFELAYFKHALKTALKWAALLGKTEPKWQRAYDKIALPPIYNNLYIAHKNRPDTFDTKTTDHPSMLMCLGYLEGEEIDGNIMENTLKKVMETWDFSSLWGWDFAVLFMTAARLGLYDMAFNLLLSDAEKNHYTKSGNNRQLTRSDLPLYLPGNGSLLLAMAVLINILNIGEGAKTFSDITLHWENFDLILNG